ncbi:hypothetical protein PR048_018544 [Dryococelus australis]|uniref:Uncharacterized protein n=1 Tax=Dryococelus australis TaxID=614101 RepID=A0ABQ9HCN6_9NEOP|nr:hypothetical protein PR048_018544 [Dryococelus australis]
MIRGHETCDKTVALIQELFRNGCGLVGITNWPKARNPKAVGKYVATVANRASTEECVRVSLHFVWSEYFYQLCIFLTQEIHEVSRDMLFGVFGSPAYIVCGSAVNLVSTDMKEFMFCWGVKLVFIAPHHPQANAVERYYRNSKRCYKMYLCRAVIWQKAPAHPCECMVIKFAGIGICEFKNMEKLREKVTQNLKEYHK